MPRKESVSKQMIEESAYALLQEEGIENVTARKLAAKIGCSTQPIFRHFANMEELWDALFYTAHMRFAKFYLESPSKSMVPFVNLGLIYIRFAQEESMLFRMLFLDENRHGMPLYELLNKNTNAVKMELLKASKAGVRDAGDLFEKMWIFISGAASMSITGDYDLDAQKTQELLENAFYSFSGLKM